MHKCSGKKNIATTPGPELGTGSISTGSLQTAPQPTRGSGGGGGRGGGGVSSPTPPSKITQTILPASIKTQR